MTREEAIKWLKTFKGNTGMAELSQAFDVAIKALEQKPCDDAISRKKVIDTIFRECSYENLDIDFAKVLLLRRKIKALPSVQPESDWIPVSERLPEPRIDVWCNSDMGQMVGYYDEYVETWYGRDYLELMVTALMLLPKPYKAESEA